MSRRIKCGEPDPDGEYGCEVMEQVIAAQDKEIKRLKSRIAEFIYGEENPDYETEMDRLQSRIELLEAELEFHSGDKEWGEGSIVFKMADDNDRLQSRNELLEAHNAEYHEDLIEETLRANDAEQLNELLAGALRPFAEAHGADNPAGAITLYDLRIAFESLAAADDKPKITSCTFTRELPHDHGCLCGRCEPAAEDKT